MAFVLDKQDDMKNIYEAAKKVYNREITSEHAIQELVIKTGARAASLQIYFNIYKYMREGKCYKMGTSAGFTKYLLEKIYDDFGEEALCTALMAVKLHAGYRESVNNSQPGIEKICREIIDEKEVGFDYNFLPEYHNVEEYADTLADVKDDSVRYWLYSPGEGSAMWDYFHSHSEMGIGWAEIGDLRVFGSKEEIKQKMKDTYDPTLSYMNAAHATWQFANEMKVGDIIFVKKGRNQIIGRGVVTGDYYFRQSAPEYPHRRSVKWTHKGEWPHPSGQDAMKTLTDVTPYTDYVEKLCGLFVSETEADVEEQIVTFPEYTETDFLSDVYIESEEYATLVELIRTKKNVILQGTPGVGKTFAAKRLAYSMMGVKDQNRVMMIQFHQSYSYEDFIMGFRPSEAGFELKKGAFYTFCKKAEIDSDNEYFFIIDEINRGNLSKIFGELFMLIESDKRGIQLQLLYSDEKFAVPKNVYIIGMMNTADRSLAMLDYALRRRFAFYEMRPGFETEGFREYRMALENDKFNNLIHCVESLNAVISEDDALGEGFCIGHSYFCNLTAETITDRKLYGIVEYELIPLLKEYWFDEPLKVKDWTNNLRSAIK